MMTTSLVVCVYSSLDPLGWCGRDACCSCASSYTAGTTIVLPKMLSHSTRSLEAQFLKSTAMPRFFKNKIHHPDSHRFALIGTRALKRHWWILVQAVLLVINFAVRTGGVLERAVWFARVCMRVYACVYACSAFGSQT